MSSPTRKPSLTIGYREGSGFAVDIIRKLPGRAFYLAAGQVPFDRGPALYDNSCGPGLHPNQPFLLTENIDHPGLRIQDRKI